VVLLGALVALSNLGVSVTPVLTALGVGSLAVALALQPTLTNLFAGFQITLARQVRIGDYVELEGGQAGFVQDISWRSTLIRELADNLVVVPNARLAEIIVRNFTLPDAEMSVVVPCAVAYGSNLDHVERVVIEAAREVQRSVPGAVRGFEPLVRYHTFGESSIGLSIVIRVDDIAARSVAQSEVLKRLHTRFAAEGIEIPLPQRVVRTVRAAAD
jgi:small-conductance mechanosensitive channel